MRILVDLCYLMAGLVIGPWMFIQSRRTGKYRSDWEQRRGHVPDLPHVSQRIWIHAVSVGEMNAVRGLVDAWRARCPDAEFVISTTTDTGKARAEQIFSDLQIIRFPLDFSPWVRRALQRIKPTLVVLVELEVWYQFTTQAAAMDIPVVVVNGRLSERSAKRFGLIRPLVRPMFDALAWVGAQDETYADRFRALGSTNVSVTGSLKWDTAEMAEAVDGSMVLAEAMGITDDRPLWVCGSTGPGEERAIIGAYQQVCITHPAVRLAIIPRKPERFDEVADLIRESGYTCLRRSESPDDTKRSVDDKTVLLGDTMGELRKFYSLADVVFVGRTLAAMGGSDMMEVAALAKPTVVGRHTENFADIMRLLEDGSGILVVDSDLRQPDVADRLADAIDLLLKDKPYANELAQAGRRVVMQNRGTTEKTLDALVSLMDA